MYTVLLRIDGAFHESPSLYGVLEAVSSQRKIAFLFINYSLCRAVPDVRPAVRPAPKPIICKETRGWEVRKVRVGVINRKEMNCSAAAHLLCSISCMDMTRRIICT